MVFNWSNIKAFTACYIQVLIVTLNTYFVISHNFLNMFIVSFFISLNWSINVHVMRDSNNIKKIIYAAGGAFGCTTAGVIHYLLCK